MGPTPDGPAPASRRHGRRHPTFLPRPARMPTWWAMSDPAQPSTWHGTTILSLRKGGQVVIAGDGQVTFGNTVIKSNARKVRRLGKEGVIAGFAGATADAFALF